MNFSPSSRSPAQQQTTITTGFPCSSVRDERQRRRLAMDDDRHQLVRRLRDPVAIEAQHLPGLLHRPEDRPGQHLRPQRHAAELELGDDPEVAPAPAHAPEEVRVLLRARLDELSVGRHEVDGDELVDRQPVLAHDPADPAAEREPGHAGVRDDAGRHREPERLRFPVELAEQARRPARAPCAVSGSTRTPFIGERSITSASSATDRPGNECPPLRTATGRPLARPNFTAAITSATPAQRTITAGRLSNEPFQILRCTS